MFKLTKQSELWPRHARQGENWIAAQSRQEATRFQIKDDLLYSCITYGDGVPNNMRLGFTIGKGLGYVLLSYFVRKAFGIHRFPFFEDRLSASVPNGEHRSIKKILPLLTETRVDDICYELRRLYEHGQQQLAECGLRTVQLTRRVQNESNGFWGSNNYADLLVRLKEAAEYLGHNYIQFEMDFLNSFGDDGGYSHYPVTMQLAIPAHDVLYCSAFVGSREKSAFGGDKDAVESGEWVILNRAPDGVVEVPSSAISYREEAYRALYKPTEHEHRQFWEDYQPYVFRRQDFLHIEQPYHGRYLARTWPERLREVWRVLRSPYL